MEGERKKFYKKLIQWFLIVFFLNNVTFIKTSNRAFCWQKEFVLNLHKWCTFIDPFTANHCSLFLIAAPFLALSILMIFLDKCQMKSFENINLLIKLYTTFCLKNFFFEKSFYLKEKYIFKNKNFLNCFCFYSKKKYLIKKILEEKICFLKHTFFEKSFFPKVFFQIFSKIFITSGAWKSRW